MTSLVGQRFGLLAVGSLSHRDKWGKPLWNCKCDCGGGALVADSNLKTGQSSSCGCRFRTRGGRSKTDPLYQVWNGVLQRCTNPSQIRYRNYGGRGIKVCERWLLSFDAFCADMGPRPSPDHSIERKDNSGNYEPGNCVWATPIEQQRNKTASRWLEYGGERLTIAEWAERTGISYTALRQRLNAGWSAERALTASLRRTSPSLKRQGSTGGVEATAP